MSQLSASSVTSPVIVRSVASTSHSIVISLGTVNVGTIVSITFMVCTKVVVLLHASVKDQVLEMTDSWVHFPAATLSEYVASRPASQLSVSLVTSPVIVKSFGSISQSMVISSGTVNVGAVESFTFTVWVTTVWFPQLSVAVQVLASTY